MIALRTKRYGIIREHGAGRGWPRGERAADNKTSTGRSRSADPWISEAFNEVVPRLADQLAEIKGDDFVRLVDDEFKGILKDRYRI